MSEKMPPSSSGSSSSESHEQASGTLPPTNNQGDSAAALPKQDHTHLRKEKVTLKLILASGKSVEFIFPLIASVGEVTEYVYNNWPEEWTAEKESIASYHVLRLIYQGRFLHENVTFLALNLAPGKRTVMHLVPREKLPQLSPDDMEKVPKTTERSCCCAIL